MGEKDVKQGSSVGLVTPGWGYGVCVCDYTSEKTIILRCGR
jgi:hypothetical protein